VSQVSNEKGQIITRVPSEQEIEFMNSVAIPMLDGTQDERSLELLFETFWNLCLWENERKRMLDAKASYLLGLSTIAAAVIAVGGGAQALMHTKLLLAGGISLGFFTLTVIASLFTLFGKKYGSFNDQDVFNSLCSHVEPVGPIKAFEDKDQRRCFMRESTLQRWLIYRWYSDGNDAKYGRLVIAQILALLSVLSLFGYLVTVLLSN
jgi:hypothetical protein